MDVDPALLTSGKRSKFEIIFKSSSTVLKILVNTPLV